MVVVKKRHFPKPSFVHLRKTSEHIDCERKLRVPLKFLRSLDPVEAFCLTVLLHADDCSRLVRSEDGYDGWFHINTKHFKALCPISDKRIKRSLKTLIDLQVVKVQRRGMPARRWLHIDAQQLMNLFGFESKELRHQNLFSTMS